MKLGDRVAVVSPHLDDAVWSCGSLIASTSDVHIVTVFANDPKSQHRSGGWDERSGFRTIGAATRARREEDRAACLILDAVPVHLPHFDSQYGISRDVDKIMSDLGGALKDRDTVLVPGWPLVNADHWWAAELALRSANELGASVWLYAEEPYRTWAGPFPPGRSPIAPHGKWQRRPDRGEKDTAMRAYKSQLEVLASEISMAELGGELVCSVIQSGELYAPVTP